MKFIILGCGSSMGVPRPDGFFGNCDPNNKKNYRTRCSALIKTKDENNRGIFININNFLLVNLSIKNPAPNKVITDKIE